MLIQYFFILSVFVFLFLTCFFYLGSKRFKVFVGTKALEVSSEEKQKTEVIVHLFFKFIAILMFIFGVFPLLLDFPSVSTNQYRIAEGFPSKVTTSRHGFQTAIIAGNEIRFCLLGQFIFADEKYRVYYLPTSRMAIKVENIKSSPLK